VLIEEEEEGKEIQGKGDLSVITLKFCSVPKEKSVLAKRNKEL
jgi:hypothetical protein